MDIPTPPNPSAKIAELEALLFIHGEPLSLKKIASVLGLSDETLGALFQEYEALLSSDARGFSLLYDGERKRVQLVTKPQFSKLLEEFVKEELREELTPASLETLSLIAYLGPVSRAEIEYIRGVNSSFILRSLLLRGLVERIPDAARPGGVRYAPTIEFLRYVGVKSQDELPEREKFKALLTWTHESAVAEPVSADAQSVMPPAKENPSQTEHQSPYQTTG